MAALVPLARPKLHKDDLCRQYEQGPDKDASAKHERGNGIYPSEPHGTSLQGLATPRHWFERCGYRCGPGSNCIMVAAMQQPMAMANVIVIRETHISPPPFAGVDDWNPYPNAEVRWLVPDVPSRRLKKSADR
jgi:hypothetical protein